ncbi:MAG TPA: SRPBCC domain-containing protein [Flavisolibacter sp.]|nr:SRPBCC domain-containing protein [Flavisolibacter sp.]
MNNPPIIKEITLNTAINKVWKAITDKYEMKQWYFDLDDFRPEPGFSFQFWGGTDARRYLHLCTVKDVDAEKKLSYSWRYEGISGNTLVTFDLFEEGDKTRLILTHSGLESFPSDNPDLAAENFSVGWEYIIKTSLKNYLEK